MYTATADEAGIASSFPQPELHSYQSLTILRSPTNMRIVSSVLRARPTASLRRAAPPLPARVRFSSSDAHSQESFEAFSDRYVAFFQGAEDLFEVQRGLNNCFAHDLVPSTGVIEAAVRAARRVNDYATAVRIFEGVKEKVENKQQYQAYLDELKPLREELGTSLMPFFSFFFVGADAGGSSRHRDKRRNVLFMNAVYELDGWTR